MSSSAPQEQPQSPATAAAAASGGVSGASGPPPEQVAQAVEAAKAAARFQDAADALKKQAALATDPAEREKLWRAAYMKEKEAHGESRKARFMASGWGQGAGLAVGISSAVGMGLGNVVGALLSGVVAVPGVLVGSGVGALHGPWYKLKDVMSGVNNKMDGGTQENDKIKAEVGSETDEDSGEDVQAHMAIVDAARKLDQSSSNKEVEGDDKKMAAPTQKKEAEGNKTPAPSRKEAEDNNKMAAPIKKKEVETAAPPQSAADKEPKMEDKKPQEDKTAKQPPTPGKQGRTEGPPETPHVTKEETKETTQQ